MSLADLLSECLTAEFDECWQRVPRVTVEMIAAPVEGD